jgi:hypothetical protein
LKKFNEIPNEVAAYCKHCSGHRVLDVKGFSESMPYQNGVYVEDYIEKTILATCRNCRQPIMVQSWESAYDPADKSNEFRTIYPRDKGSARELHFDVPKQILSSYNEAVKCETSEAWNACAVMVGRALEAVAKGYDTRVRTIATGIKKMHNAGVISSELFEWANELRFLRNIGAHASEVNVEEADAHEALDFLQAILETIYHLRPMFQKRKAKRNIESE